MMTTLQVKDRTCSLGLSLSIVMLLARAAWILAWVLQLVGIPSNISPIRANTATGTVLVVLIMIAKHTSTTTEKSGNFEEQDLLLIVPKGYTACPRATWRDYGGWEMGRSEDLELCLYWDPRDGYLLFFFFLNVCVSNYQSIFLTFLYWICYYIASVIYVLIFWLWGLWDLISLTKYRILILCIGRWSLNWWTTRESITGSLFISKFKA